MGLLKSGGQILRELTEKHGEDAVSIGMKKLGIETAEDVAANVSKLEDIVKQTPSTIIEQAPTKTIGGESVKFINQEPPNVLKQEFKPITETPKVPNELSVSEVVPPVEAQKTGNWFSNLSTPKKIGVGAAGAAIGGTFLSGLLGGNNSNPHVNTPQPLSPMLDTPPATVEQPVVQPSQPEVKSTSQIQQRAIKPANTEMLMGGDLLRNADLGSTNASDEALKAAQRERDRIQEIASLGKLAQTAGHTMTQTTPGMDTSFWDTMHKQGEQKVTDYNALVANEKNDPDSKYSKIYKKTLSDLGIKIPGNPSASDLEKIFPEIKGIIQSREKDASDEKELKFRYAQLASEKGKQGDIKKDKFIMDLRKEATGGSNKDLYTSAKVANKIDTALTEFSADPTGFKDYGMLMQAFKALQGDNSVVRGTEMALGINATSMMNKAKNALDSAVSGKMLQPQQRKEILDAVGIMSRIAKENYQESTTDILEQANRLGVNPSEIFDPGLHGIPSKLNEERLNRVRREKLERLRKMEKGNK